MTARRVLAFGWMLLVGLTAVGHVTAARNTLTIVVAVATLAVLMRDVRGLPCKAAVGALVLWASASVLWSAAPDVTLGKLRSDLWLPVVAAIAAFHFARDAEGLRPIVVGFVVGLVALASLSCFAYLPIAWVPAWLPTEQSGGIVRPLPHWYPGPGDASMFTILAIAPLILAWRRWPRRRAAIGCAAALLVFVLITTNNRNAVLVAPVVVFVQWLLDRRIAAPAAAPARSSAARWAALVVGAALALGAVLELGARQRLAYLHQPRVEPSAALQLVANDTRPTIWRYYAVRGIAHPWIGLGFGRTVPGIAWRTQADRELAAIEPNAYIHAHNVFLDWWLQLGLVGLALVACVAVAIAATARRLVRAARDDPAARRTRHALFAVALAVLARDLSDDFLVYGMATAFGVLVAALLGELARLADARASAGRITSPRSPSGPS